jgi:hypothetical protein
MKQYFRLTFFLGILLLINGRLPAQIPNPTQKLKIVIFAPLYLDSAFDAGLNYRYDKAFPKYINPGLEFYEGAKLALDSMAMEGKQLEVFVYDTRSAQLTLKDRLNSPELSNADLFLAYCSNGSDLTTLAYAAAARKIPFVNVNLPVDGGIYNNPYYVLLNPTLKTHIESIYRFALKNYYLNDIVVFRKKGMMEDQIKKYLEEAGNSFVSVPLKIKYVDMPDSVSTDILKANLKSNNPTLCIAGSLDENFGRQLALKLAPFIQQYRITLIGMPTFDNIGKEFSRPVYKGLPIIYTTPFYNNRTDKVSQEIVNFYNNSMYARPTDMVMRGYEAIWHFAQLLVKYKSDLSSNLSRKEFNVFREFDIQPVINRQRQTLDYFENKKLFFIKWLNGTETVE